MIPKCSMAVALLACLPVGGMAQPRPKDNPEKFAEDFMDNVRKSIDSKLYHLRPHKFNVAGYIQGGVTREDGDLESGNPYLIPIETIAILEAKIIVKDKELKPERLKTLKEGCRKMIEGNVKEQLDLIAAFEAKVKKAGPKPDEEVRDKLGVLYEELRQKLTQKQAGAWKSITEAAAKAPEFNGLRMEPIYETNVVRKTITFKLNPKEGAGVFILSAGDYENHKFLVKVGRIDANAEPNWKPVEDRVSLALNSRYVAYAYWDDGKKSDIKKIPAVTEDADFPIKKP